MATKTDSRYNLSTGTKLRLYLRMLAITAVVCVVIGAMILAPVLNTFSLDSVLAAAQGENGEAAKVGSYVVIGGLAVIFLWLVVEIAGLFTSAGSRSLVGANALVQVALALAVVVGINLYSFLHYQRWDLTRDKQFTLPPEVVNELKKLKSETTIAVVLKDKSNEQIDSHGFDLAAKTKAVEKVEDLVDLFREVGPSFKVSVISPEAHGFDSAAKTKAIEKIEDLVELFREVGPSFQVSVLGVKGEQYDKKLETLTKDKPILLEAIKAAPESSIFFYANNKVQRLSFNEFYPLNKSASKERSNLVLQPQGIETFTKRVLAIEEKRPKVALCVVHDLLSSQPNDYEYYTHAGLRKSLEANGFDVVDIILKKWDANMEAAAYSPDEYRLEETTEDLDSLRAALRELEEEKRDSKETQTTFRNPPKGFAEEFRRRFRREFTEEIRKQQLDALDDELKRIDERTVELEKEKSKLQATLKTLEQNDRLLEDRKLSNVKSKMTRILDECDLLIVPRNTWLNIPERSNIPARAHALSDAGEPDPLSTTLAKQVEVMRAFMKRGKPVLACLGPNNEFPFRGPGQRPLGAGYDTRTGAMTRPLDGFERLLGDCGIELSRQIILFDEEQKSFTAARTRENFGGGSRVNLPPVGFNIITPKEMKPNPIGAALKFASQSVAQPLDIRLRHPRPVYLVAGLESKLPFASEFLFTSPDSWNEERPFGTIRQVDQTTGVVEPPRYDATRLNDPKKGTRDEERRGPFPIGVALQTKVPAEWYDEKYQTSYRSDDKDYQTPGFADLKTLAAFSGLLHDPYSLLPAAVTALAAQEKQQFRLAVLGHGGVFTGKELTPAREKLLLYSCNWLLGRDEKLPRTDTQEWTYPRVALSDSEKFYWHWGTFLGLPLFFAYVGLLVLLFRRVR